MLLLTRKINQKIIIANGEVKITVLSIQGNKVKFGIEAPDHIKVHREEVFDKIKSEENSKNEKPSLETTHQKLINNVASQFAVDSKLLDEAEGGSAIAQFKLGKFLYEQNRYGFAAGFLKRALDQGILEAKQYLLAMSH